VGAVGHERHPLALGHEARRRELRHVSRAEDQRRAARIFTRLAGRSALILGAGDMAELAATCLVSEGVRVTLVANRTYERARAIAEQLGARALTLDEAWE